MVLACSPQIVPEALAAMEGRSANTMALTGLIGRGAMAWDGLLADARHGIAKRLLDEVPVVGDARGAASGAASVGDIA